MEDPGGRSGRWGGRWVALLLLVLPGCGDTTPPHLLGGTTTVLNATPNAFSHQTPGLTGEPGLLFFVGNSFFNQNWVSAPASTTARDGLGPHFNARSCAGCHLHDGRGRPPAHEGERGSGLLLRLGIPGKGPGDPTRPDPVYGNQLQDGAIPGIVPEGSIRIRWEEVPGRYGDGSTYVLRRPVYEVVDLGYGPLAPDVRLSPRVGSHLVGLGLLEAVPEESIRSRADPGDRDGDGISGRVNEVPDRVKGGTSLGRFGWKANQPSLLQQTAEAFLGDLGITTSLLPEENCGGEGGEACRAAPHGGRPEIDDEDLAKVVLYVSSLAVPAMRDPAEFEVTRGSRLFREIGCTACHTPTLQTGEHPTLPVLSNQTIHPYTDLLLHDMGEGLADGLPDHGADGREWRTPPLWGIGLIPLVNGHSFYLHDGRARTLEEAVLWHGGEAESSRERFRTLSPELRAALVRFLESL